MRTQRVSNCGLDGVSRGELILAIAPELHARAVVDPRHVPKARSLGHRHGGHERGEGLIEPQAVPPLHRHEVAKVPGQPNHSA